MFKLTISVRQGINNPWLGTALITILPDDGHMPPIEISCNFTGETRASVTTQCMDWVTERLKGGIQKST